LSQIFAEARNQKFNKKCGGNGIAQGHEKACKQLDNNRNITFYHSELLKLQLDLPKL
jgi:hypothetical protein